MVGLRVLLWVWSSASGESVSVESSGGQTVAGVVGAAVVLGALIVGTAVVVGVSLKGKSQEFPKRDLLCLSTLCCGGCV